MSHGYVVSAFAGLGKTYLAKNNDNYIDLESSDFQWLENDKYGDKESSKGNTEKIKNPLFPNNYVKEMKKLITEGKVPLIAAQPEVIEAASKAGLYIFMAYPALDSKEDILKRYKDRGNAEGFIKLMESNFEKFVESMKSNMYAVASFEVEKGEFLAGYLTNEDLDDIIGEELLEMIPEPAPFADVFEYFDKVSRGDKRSEDASLSVKSTSEGANWATKEDTLKIMLELDTVGAYVIVKEAHSYEQGQAVMNAINTAPNYEDVVIDLKSIDSITSNFLHGMVSECPRLHSKSYREKYIHILSESARVNSLINEEVRLYTK